METADVIPLVLKTDGGDKLAVLTPVHTTKATGVVAPVLSGTQPFHAGSVDEMQIAADIIIDLLLPAAAADIIAVDQFIHRDILFIAAGTPAMPVDGAFAVPLLCWVERCQPTESLVGDVQHLPAILGDLIDIFIFWYTITVLSMRVNQC